jgi:hypothetical protein
MEFKKLRVAFAAKCGIEGLAGTDGPAVRTAVAEICNLLPRGV